MIEKPEHRHLSSTGSYSYKLQVVSELIYGNEERQSNSTGTDKTNTACGISKVASHSNVSATSTSDGNQTSAADSGLSSNSQRLQILTYEVSQYGTSVFGYTSTSPPLRRYCPEGQYEINGLIHE